MARGPLSPYDEPMPKAKIRWTPEAEAMMKKVPFFVRPLAKRKTEEAARERGLDEITVPLLEELRDANMPKDAR